MFKQVEYNLTPWKDKKGQQIKVGDKVLIEMSGGVETEAIVSFSKRRGCFDITNIKDELYYYDEKIPFHTFVSLGKVVILESVNDDKPFVMECDICLKKLNYNNWEVLHASCRENGKINGHIHLCESCYVSRFGRIKSITLNKNRKSKN